MTPVGERTAAQRAMAWWSRAVTTAIGWLGRAEPLYGLAGPIFEKDLRVSARRRRTYVLRFAYLAVLGGIVGMIWLSMLTMPWLFGRPVVYAYAMTEAGLMLTTTIAWFQFLVLQPVAIVMLSTSISDEVQHRTLGVLLTAPINSAHIVLGKFLGKMFQLVLLLAISVPMLIVVRVLGGVTWEFVMASTAITLTMTMFVGALSMFFSISSRALPMVILKTVVAVLVLFLLVPLVAASQFPLSGGSAAEAFLIHANPYVAMAAVTSLLYSPGAAGTPAFSTWAHCLAMFGATVLVLAVSMVRVRRAALRQLGGDVGGGRSARPGARKDGRIRRVRGSPVVWKESRTRIFRSRARGLFGTALALGVLGVTYWLVGKSAMADSFSHIVYALALLTYGGLCTAVIAAIGVTAEKEAGTWPILLVTPLTDSQVALGKAIGAVRRSLPAWIPLAFHLGLFAALGQIHPVVIPMMAMLAFGVTVLLTGSGLLWSVLFRRTVSAAVANVLVCFGLWVGLPIVASTGLGFLVLVGPRFALAGVALMLHPAVQTGLVLEGASGAAHAGRGLGDLRFTMPLPQQVFGTVGVAAMAGAVFVLMAVHVGIGWLLARWASRRIRKSAL